MATKTDIRDMAAELMFHPVAALILRIYLLEADPVNKSLESLRESVGETWVRNNFPVLRDEQFDQEFRFLLDHQLVIGVGVPPLTCSVTEFGREVGQKVWAAYLAFLRAP